MVFFILASMQFVQVQICSAAFITFLFCSTAILSSLRDAWVLGSTMIS